MDEIEWLFPSALVKSQDSIIRVRHVDVLRSSPFEDCLASLNVNFLEETVVRCLVPNVTELSANRLYVGLYRFENDQKGSIFGSNEKLVQVSILPVGGTDFVDDVVGGVEL